MNPNWDLSYLYTGFDDPAFLADLKRFPEEIKVEQAILDGGDDPQTKLEKLTDQQEVLGALSDRLSSFCSLTQAVDANNADATKYLNVLDVIFNDSRIVSSAVTRYIGGLANLEDLIAASPKLQKVAFYLRESAENAHHTIPEAVEPWILEMSLSGGSAFSQLRDKLDSTHTANYRGQEIPLSAVRGLAYDADASVRKDAYEAEIASYKKMELPMSYCLNAVKMEARTLSKAKGYPSVLDMTLSDSRMDRATLDAMLTAIREYAEFGSGFKIAMRDLEIRGAGDLLGAEQSGHMMTVGYDMYLKLLEDAVLEERGEAAQKEPECTADLTVTANINKDYVASGEQRMDLYRRMAAIRTQEDADELLDEIVDRFGDPPKGVMNLIAIALLRARAAAAGITEITQKDGAVLLSLSTCLLYTSDAADD